MTQVDSRIALGVQPLDVGTSIGNAFKLKYLSQQADAAKLDSELKQQAVQKQKTLGDFYKQHTQGGKLDRSAFTQAVTDAGYGADAPDLQKGWLEGDKSQAEYQSKIIENGIKANDYTTKAIAGLMMRPGITPADVHSEIGNLAKIGVLTPDQAQTYSAQVPNTTPQALDSWLRSMFHQALSTKEQLERLTPNVTAQNLGGHTEFVDMNPNTNPGVVGRRAERSATFGERESVRHNRASEGLTARGQNMADARAREANNSGKAPSGYRWGPDGQSLIAIPGGPADKGSTATEGERKAATLLKRLEGSQAQLNDALEENEKAAKPGVLTSGVRAVGLESVANTMTSEQRQRVDAAQLDILDAALTLGTGAAYTREQLQGYQRAYFPQIGDSAGTVKDKKARLDNVISSARIAAGRAGPGADGRGGVSGTWDAPSAPGAKPPKTVNFSDLK